MDVDCYFDGAGNDRVICSCSCSFCGSGLLPFSARRRSRKRKVVEVEEKAPSEQDLEMACIEMENGVVSLREAIDSQHQAIQDLHSHLDAERRAAATAASEAMSMILRLQREKADAQMDARQFKLFAEEKMAHDKQEIDLLEDLLFQQDEVVESLFCEIQAYRHRLLSIGFSPFLCQPSILSAGDDSFSAPCCDSIDFPEECLHQNLSRLMEKGITGISPRPSVDGFGSPFQKEIFQNEFPFDHAFDTGGGRRDANNDQVYKIDDVRDVDGIHCDHMGTPIKHVSNRSWVGLRSDEADIKMLHIRLQALEEERELAKQSILSMGMDKAQVVLLEEIAHKLRKEVERRRVVKKSSFLRTFSLISAITWLASFFFWRKKSSRIRQNGREDAS